MTILIIIAVDVFLLAGAVALNRANAARSERGLPVTHALGALAGVIAIHLFAIILLNMLIPGWGIGLISLPSVVLVAPAVVVSALTFRASVAARTAYTLYGRVASTDAESIYEGAAWLVEQNDLAAATAMLEAGVRRFPNDERLLFALAEVYETNEEPRSAAETYERIRRRFDQSPIVWRKASLRLARLHADRMDNEKEAETLREEVAVRSASHV